MFYLQNPLKYTPIYLNLPSGNDGNGYWADKSRAVITYIDPTFPHQKAFDNTPFV